MDMTCKLYVCVYACMFVCDIEKCARDAEAVRALHQLHSLCQQVPQTDRSFISDLTVGEYVEGIRVCVCVCTKGATAVKLFCFVFLGI